MAAQAMENRDILRRQRKHAEAIRQEQAALEFSRKAREAEEKQLALRG
jgi:hypothetical protein